MGRKERLEKLRQWAGSDLDGLSQPIDIAPYSFLGSKKHYYEYREVCFDSFRRRVEEESRKRFGMSAQVAKGDAKDVFDFYEVRLSKVVEERWKNA